MSAFMLRLYCPVVNKNSKIPIYSRLIQFNTNIAVNSVNRCDSNITLILYKESSIALI